MPAFEPDYPLASLRPADYNPRRLSAEGAQRLKESIDRFGIQKPVIVNGDGTLVAGHQRVKTCQVLGLETIPAVLLDRTVPRHDEIRFNLFHNSIETDRSAAQVPEELECGWRWIQPAELDCGPNRNPAVVKSICSLLTKYGPWGSIVADTEGAVVANTDYAFACKVLNLPCLAAVLEPDRAAELVHWLTGDYGVYAYDSLGVKTYNQLLCQPSRGERRTAPTYEKHVLPELKKGERVVDFGAGVGREIGRLQARGWEALAYEPNLRAKGSSNLDVAGVVRQITALKSSLERRGLFDVVVLDAVLNSVTSLDFETAVLLCCNALCGAGGRFYTSTRGWGQTVNHTWSRDTGKARYVEFLDPDGFSAVYRQGVWTLQRFMTVAELEGKLYRYFQEVRIHAGAAETGYLRASCSQPRKLDPEKLRGAADREFNMEYPGGYRHDRHAGLVEELVRRVRERDS